MQINLKVKTLDAQTHEFSIDNEVTIREFKDKIAERTNIAADQQRIIYCGRVLADEKQLKDYDVDGKVVHVAERPPPSQRGPSTSSVSSNANDNPHERLTARGGGMRNSPLFRALDGMVVGTMAIPMNAAALNNGQMPGNPFQASSSFCMNRITVARHMLECVNNIAAFLEDPSRGLNNTSLDILTRGRWTMESTVVEVGITADLPQNQNIADMFQGAVAQALSQRRNGRSNLTVFQFPGYPQFGGEEMPVDVPVDAAVGDPAGANVGTDSAAVGPAGAADPTTAAVAALASAVEMQMAQLYSSSDDEDDSLENEPHDAPANNAADEGVAANAPSFLLSNMASSSEEDYTATTSEAPGSSTNSAKAAKDDKAPTGQKESAVATTSAGSDATASGAAAAAQNSTSTGTNTDENAAQRRTGTRVLAEVIDRMREVQTRLNPFIQQFYDLLQNEPTFEENDTAARENAQRLFDHVSEALHYMSHAQHAISDLMLDVAQPAPRYLTCRPIMVEQSGYVSSNNYLSATAAAAAATAAMIRDQQQHRAQGGHGAPGQPPHPPGSAPQRPPPQAVGSRGAQSAGSTATPATAGGSNTGTVEDPVDDPIVLPNVPSVAAGTVNAGTQSNDNHQMQMARLIQAVVNSAPIDTEFHVQINAPSIVSFGVPLNAAAAAAAAASTGRRNEGSNNTAQTGQTSSTDNAEAGAATVPADATVAEDAAGVAANQSGSSANNNNPNAGGSNNESAATTGAAPAGSPNLRGSINTATLPTTSTQTRSTSRPQLQIGNMPPGAGGWNGRFMPANMTSFDRFLPCNSHHIREPEAAPEGAAAAEGASQHPGGAARTGGGATLVGGVGPVGPTRAGGSSGGAPAAIRVRPYRHFNNMRDLNNYRYETSRVPANTPAAAAATTASAAAPPAAAAATTTAPAAPLTGTATLTATAGGDEIFHDAVPMRFGGFPPPLRPGNLRQQLLHFISESVFEGAAMDASSIPSAIDRAVAWFGDRLLYLQQYERPGYNSVDSMHNVLRHILPRLFQLFRDEQENVSAFERLLTHLCEEFFNKIYSVMIVCVGEENAVFYWDILMRSLLVAIRSNFSAEACLFLVDRINIEVPSSVDAAAVGVFVVQRPTTEESSAVSMDMDVEMSGEASASCSADGRDDTAVVILPTGSQPWHKNVPNEWLPLITRDLQQQTENPPQQTPFSDAYISGMSAKRKKLIQSAKPASEVRALIADSVRLALQSGGVSTSTASNESQTADEITAAIASDNVVRSSYTEALRSSLRERIRQDAEYKADKYPCTTKFVNHK